MANKQIKAGIIGTGTHGSRYAKHIINDLADSLVLTAISRQSQDKGESQARDWGVSFFRDWNELISCSEVDVVIAVATPNMNSSIAARCCEFKKPLFIEKPLSVDYESAAAIVAMMTDSGIPLTVGQTLRYNSIIQALKDNLSTVGTLRCFTATHRLEPSIHNWLEIPDIAGGGVILHTAVHVFDALRFITGKEILRVRASSYKRHNPQLEDLFTAQVEMEDKVIGLIEASKVGKARSGRYEFLGDHGLLQGDQVLGSIQKVTGMQTTRISHEPPKPAILPLLRDWTNYLHDKGPNPIPGSEGLAAVRICQACRDSAAADKWVTL